MNNAIGPHSQKLVIAAVNSVRYFSISTDASNHGHQKIFPVIVFVYVKVDCRLNCLALMSW